MKDRRKPGRLLWLMLPLLAGCQSTWNEVISEPALLPQPARPEWMAYDAAFADAVQNRWCQLLDARPTPPDSGRVVLEFRLHPDGMIDDLFVAENTEGEILGAICQKALLDPMPYAVWPGKMQALFGGPRRFSMKFEFDAVGVGYVGYSENWMELARNDKPPKETKIVLGYARGAPPHSVSQ